jgi:hypothetical protein
MHDGAVEGPRLYCREQACVPARPEPDDRMTDALNQAPDESEVGHTWQPGDRRWQVFLPFGVDHHG